MMVLQTIALTRLGDGFVYVCSLNVGFPILHPPFTAPEGHNSYTSYAATRDVQFVYRIFYTISNYNGGCRIRTLRFPTYEDGEMVHFSNPLTNNL
jgi:hypothetical protein